MDHTPQEEQKQHITPSLQATERSTYVEARLFPLLRFLGNTQHPLNQAIRRVMQDKIARVAAIVLLALYAAIIFAQFLAPYSADWNNRTLANAPPTPVFTVDDRTGGLSWPYVYPYERKWDPQTFEITYQLNTTRKYYVHFMALSSPYRMFGLIPGNVHLFGVDAPAQIALLGDDMNGRDNFSRLLFGGRVSLTIGFLSLLIAFPVGMIYGGISGYFGGRIDNLMMRFAEIIMSIPSLYLLISLAAILPANLSSSARFTMVTVILALVGWAGLSRVIRGMVLSLKEQEFVEAERALGLGDLGIITRHILPQTASYVIVAMTSGVPGYILAESGLSFLGLGIQQPDASWGNMLREAQEITNLIGRPWMLMPGLLIFLAVLSFNVIGDAVRDVLDPKAYIRR